MPDERRMNGLPDGVATNRVNAADCPESALPGAARPKGPRFFIGRFLDRLVSRKSA
jgi:hypothetical protein